mgnify:CR=1 FL=1
MSNMRRLLRESLGYVNIKHFHPARLDPVAGVIIHPCERCALIKRIEAALAETVELQDDYWEKNDRRKP